MSDEEVIAFLDAVSEELSESVRWSTILPGRYMGPENADRYGAGNAEPGELPVRVRPSSIVAMAGLSE